MPASPQLCSPARVAPGEFACLLRGGSLALDAAARGRQRRSWLASALMQALLAVGIAAALRAVPALPLRAASETLTWLPETAPEMVVPPVALRRPTRHFQALAPNRPRSLPLRRPALASAVVPRVAMPAPLPPLAPPPLPALTRPDLVAPPAPAPKVELGKFGAPTGLLPERGAIVAAPVMGMFGAAASADPPSGPSATVSVGGFGSAAATTADATASGDAAAAVQRAGFGNAGGGVESAVGGAVAVGGFASASAPLTPDPPAAGETAADFVPPQILAWPTPVYTAAAAAHHVEGEVVLSVRLAADGRAEVLAVLQGLGYGLDAAARTAAAQLQFRPARRAGVAVSWTVRVHIQFRLAN